MIFERFVGVVSAAYPSDLCRAAVAFLGVMARQGFVRDGHSVRAPADIFHAVNGPLWETHHAAYTHRFGVLRAASVRTGGRITIRKVPVGGPDLAWRGPIDAEPFSKHLLEWLVFLDDHADGGELEFLQQGLRVAPRAGTLVIWPSAFTHAHRVCAPRDGDQHLLRGWIDLT